MHSCKYCSSPFNTVFGPNSNETPLLAFTLDPWAQIHHGQTSGKVLYDLAHLVVGLPLIVTIDRLVGGSLRGQNFPSSQERLISELSDVATEYLKQCVELRVLELHGLEVVVMLGRDFDVDELARVARRGLLVHAPLSVEEWVVVEWASCRCGRFYHVLM